MTATTPPLDKTCLAIAATFRAHARTAYAAGDQQRGDYLFRRALEWELAANEGGMFPE